MAFHRDHLRYFVAVAEEGQITQAARRLFIAQPALSHAISQLEAELGLRLLDRHARGVTLTDAGEAFLEKARAAVESEIEVTRTAESLARAERGVLEVGFIGPPPSLSATELIDAFTEANPDADLSFRDLPFPHGTTRSWLEPVDVVLCQAPDLTPDIRMHPVRHEPRAAIIPARHRLAEREMIEVADLLDETFIGLHADVQPGWAARHSLDEERGGPPRSVTDDHVATALQILGVFATTTAVTTLPMANGRLVEQVVSPVRAIPLSDAEPAVLSLVWRVEDEHPLVSSLVELAGAGPDPAGSPDLTGQAPPPGD